MSVAVPVSDTIYSTMSVSISVDAEVITFDGKFVVGTQLTDTDGQPIQFA